MDFLKDLSIDKIRNVAEDAFNQAKPKTDVEARVYEVLSHKNWGSSSSMMNEIARDTYDYDKFVVVTKLMWEAVETPRPAAWRVVFKGLTLLEHLIKNGSERCVDDARNHSHVLRSLHRFNYYEGTVDRGLGVREKSKQLVEILGDDERVREERQKAKKLREKFGGNLGGVSSTGGAGGGGYSGYGNESSWNSGSEGYGNGGVSGGGGGGYGDSGGGRYGDDSHGYGGDTGGGSRGRYADDSDTRIRSTASSTPTFATLPDETPKKVTKGKKLKKKKRDDDGAAPAPEVDLFSFDDPAPAPIPAAAFSNDQDGFDAFQSAPTATEAVQFDAFSSAPTPISLVGQTQSVQFDAFQSAPMAGGGMANVNNMFGAMNIGQTANPNQMGMMMGMQQPAASASNFMGGSKPAPAPAASNDDDFGDFADASAAPKTKTSSSSDPLSKLISLDSLTKNSKKEDKLNQPIVVNSAAAQFLQEQEIYKSQSGGSKKSMSADMSFAGIDGLNKMSSFQGQGNIMAPAMMRPANPSVMSSGGGSNADVIGMLSPQALIGSPQQHKPVAAVPNGGVPMGMMTPQMMANAAMMNNPAMMANAAMMGNPAMMGNAGMMNNPAMMGNAAMMGNQAMMNANMMGGMMQGGMMNMQGGMGGMPMGGMQNGMQNGMQGGGFGMQGGMSNMQGGGMGMPNQMMGNASFGGIQPGMSSNNQQQQQGGMMGGQQGFSAF